MKKFLPKILSIIIVLFCGLCITVLADDVTEIDSSNYAVLSNNITTSITLTENMRVDGNLNVGNHLNSGKNTLIVKGDLTISGSIDIGNGELYVYGDVELTTVVDNAYTDFMMTTESAYVLVHGDFHVDTRSIYTHTLTSGTLELKGNFVQKSTKIWYDRSFDAVENHKVILSGIVEQIIAFEDPTYSYFNEVINNNPDGVKFLSWSEYQTYIKNNGTSKFSVTFDTIVDGKTTTTVNANSYLTNLPTPTLTGLKFAAWYKDKDYKNMWIDNVDKVTSDITL